ncbi:MAG: hypothetical protein ACOC46_03350 [Pirellulales bacterium]
MSSIALIGAAIAIVMTDPETTPAASDEPPATPAQIHGGYGSPARFWQTGTMLGDCAINAVFMHHGGSQAEYERAMKEGALVFAEFGVFRNRKLATQRPDELWPIGADGKRIEPTERFLGLCPTSERYNREKLEELRALLQSRPTLSGIWLDYLHFHCDFELPEPPLTQSCFNDSCLERFQGETGIVPQGSSRAEKAQWILGNHANQWADWKCSVITDFARRAREVLDQERPGTLLGIYSCPWTDDEYGGAMRSIVGEDIGQLARYIDVWSPMVYHGNCQRDPAWVEGYTAWLRRKLDAVGAGGRIWPIVQGGGTPPHRPPVTPEGFEEALRGAFRGGATGVMFYHFAAVAEDPAKLAVLRRVYRDPHNRPPATR